MGVPTTECMDAATAIVEAMVAAAKRGVSTSEMVQVVTEAVTASFRIGGRQLPDDIVQSLVTVILSDLADAEPANVVPCVAQTLQEVLDKLRQRWLDDLARN